MDKSEHSLDGSRPMRPKPGTTDGEKEEQERYPEAKEDEEDEYSVASIESEKTVKIYTGRDPSRLHSDWLVS